MNNSRNVESVYTISNENILVPVRSKASLIKRLRRWILMTIIIFLVILASASITGALFRKFAGTTEENDSVTVCETEECMRTDALNHQKLKPLLSILKELELSQVPAAITHKPKDIIKQIALVRRILRLDIYFGTDVLPDYFNNTRNILFIGSPFNKNPFPSFTELEERMQEFRIKSEMLREKNATTMYGNKVDTDEDEGYDDGTEDDDTEKNEDSDTSANENEDKKKDNDMEEKSDDNNIKDSKNDTKTHQEFSEKDKPHLRVLKDIIIEILSNGTVQRSKCKSEELPSFPYTDDIDELTVKIYRTWKILQDIENYKRSEEDDNGDREGYMTINTLQRITDKYVRKKTKKYKPRKIWRPFFEELFKDIADDKVFNQIRIFVFDIQYLKLIALFFSAFDDETIETFTWWTVIETLAPYSSKRLREVINDYFDEILGPQSSKFQTLKCSRTVDELMPLAVTWLYADSNFHNQEGMKVMEMLHYIKQSFSEMVIQTEWMDQPTKITTLKKNSKMKSVIGYPEYIFSNGLLDEHYENITLSESQYLRNMVTIIRERTMNELKTLTIYNNGSEKHWSVSPNSVNAFHTFTDNQISIPYGIIQFPFYNLGLEALNFGALGVIVGHELTHGFDNTGRKFDSEGNYREWWTQGTISNYVKKSECFINHYSDYYVEEAEDYVNGKATLGENIADNGGLKEAFNAYKLWRIEHGEEPLLPGFTNLTHEQLLFISFANLWCGEYTKNYMKWSIRHDSHSPHFIRIKAVLRNSKEFSKVWKCPTGSNMNPLEKCSLW